MTNAVKKIAIIGGGVGALSAAFGITEAPNWQQQYEITIYQLGWRLGGKGASGRNQNAEERIEEHGFHVWGGFYENAFRIMRKCYDELNRPPGSPLATLQDAFKPSDTVSWAEDLSGVWDFWTNNFPQVSSQPGDGTPMPSLWEGILRVIEWMLDTLLGLDQPALQTSAVGGTSAPELPSWIKDLIKDAKGSAEATRSSVDKLESVASSETLSAERHLLTFIHKLAQACPQDTTLHSAAHHHAMVFLLDELTNHLRTKLDTGGVDDDVRRFLILCDMFAAEIRGILVDGVLFKGFDSIDEWDYQEWLLRHGACEQAANSAVSRGIYDFLFAYRNGDPEQPLIGAGSALRCILRLVMWYKGAIFWRMQSGMGDTVFTPLYQVLQKRGVKFVFFHKVKNLSLANGLVETILVSRQVNLKKGTYEPLIVVKDLASWPSEPLYDQIVEGEELKRLGINLESSWTPWKDVGEETLQRGVDFDLVILGTSLAPLKDICVELIEASPAWKNMVEQIQTVQTQSFQLWLSENLTSLGWQDGMTVLTGYAHPFESWADMSQVLPREVWPPNLQPKDVSYFCGALPDPAVIPPFSDHSFPAKEAAIVKQNAINWIEQNVGYLWPNAITTGFNWELLVDPQGGSGASRFDSQFSRANIDPSERYVLSVPRSTKFRLKANESGFDNLYLAGDWLLNGLNIGCVESAVMGGLEASQAISGYPQEIVGETDF
jgi:uncharacterized protein with NAD-binding domain and iron-sulfur cluster